MVLSVAMDANDNLLGTRAGVRDSFVGVGVRPGAPVSSIMILVFCRCRGLFPCWSSFCVRSGLTVRSFDGGDLGALGDLSFLGVELLLVCDLAVGLDDDVCLLFFEDFSEEATDAVLPRRRDSCSNVLIVSALETLDRIISDS